ncbi:MAG: hypothetical protein IT289_03185 [Oligoflexia bacterium]|nr:hypothetical protein [Oligoflexia bacterium]
MKVRWGLAAWITMAIGCSSTPTRDVDYPIQAIRATIESQLTMGIQKKSNNGYEYLSRPFVVKQPPEAEFHSFRDRGRARVTIRGYERPYTLEVEVSIERGYSKKGKAPSDEEYSHHHYDNGLAKKLLTNIYSLLDKSDRDRNVVDDFKPF